MRVVYGIQSTGKGHLSRFLGLKPHFDRDGHEVLVIASGYEDPPDYFLKAISNCRYARFQGISYVGDERGGISQLGTACAFVRHLPELLDSFRRAQDLITDFAPDVVVSDFDPVLGSMFVAPAITKVGLSHQNVLLAPDMYHPPGMLVEKLVTFAVVRTYTGGLDHVLGCHFYPANEHCLPPIIRPAILEARPENHGHIVVYHTLPGLLHEFMRYAAENPDRRVIIYGYPGHEDTRNVHFESDLARFPRDLATADAYVGTAGFQSISEAFYLGKKIAVRPVNGQYEQIWNAAQLEHWKMGRWYQDSLEEALDQEPDRHLHRRLVPWYRDGAKICYERIIELASAGHRRQSGVRGVLSPVHDHTKVP